MLCCKRVAQNVTNTQLHIFQHLRLPMFWICGPIGAGKSTLANLLAQSTNFKLIKCSELLRIEQENNTPVGHLIHDIIHRLHEEVPEDIMIQLIQDAILQDYSGGGFIIDNFPRNLTEAKLFERNICNVTIIIYVTLKLDLVVDRRKLQNPMLTEKHIADEHLRKSKIFEQINRKYHRNTIKVHTNLDPKQTCNLVLDTLNEYWGYRFTLYK